MAINSFRMGKDICKLCDTFETNSYAHILFECSSLVRYREYMLINLQRNTLPNLWHDILKMNNDDKCVLFFNLLNGPYVKEFHTVYRAICLFIYTMFSSYYSIGKVTDNALTV